MQHWNWPIPTKRLTIVWNIARVVAQTSTKRRGAVTCWRKISGAYPPSPHLTLLWWCRYPSRSTEPIGTWAETFNPYFLFQNWLLWMNDIWEMAWRSDWYPAKFRPCWTSCPEVMHLDQYTRIAICRWLHHIHQRASIDCGHLWHYHQSSWLLDPDQLRLNASRVKELLCVVFITTRDQTQKWGL